MKEEKINSKIQEEGNAMNKHLPTLNKQCPFCGKMFKTKAPGKKFCDKCVKNGFNWVYEVTGRTNGWNKNVA